MSAQKPIPMLLQCPHCSSPHIDKDEWATKPHKTHLCLECRKEFRPAHVATVGVESLPPPDPTPLIFTFPTKDGIHPTGRTVPFQYGVYFPQTDLVVTDMGGRGTGKPKWPGVEWVNG